MSINVSARATLRSRFKKPQPQSPSPILELRALPPESRTHPQILFPLAKPRNLEGLSNKERLALTVNESF